MTTECLTLQTLQAFLDGESAADSLATIQEHLADCAECLERYERLFDSQEPQTDLLQSARMAAFQERSVTPCTNGISHGSEVLSGPATMKRIRDYILLDEIGHGGMGKVYRAVHTRMDRVVALKFVNLDRRESLQAASRLEREIRLLARLEHPHIVRALDAGEYEGQPYFVMEYMAGVDLAKLLQQLGPLQVDQACEIIRQAASALQCAHEQQILHRDVKPSNLMLTREGTIKLLDLGVAQIVDLGLESSLSQSDILVGTLAYMAPETLSGSNASRQSDIFSLGVTFFQLLAGVRPFDRPQLGSQLAPQPADLTRIRPDLPRDLHKLIQRMLAVDAEQRPSSMGEIASALAPLAAGADLSALIEQTYHSLSQDRLQSDAQSSSPSVPPPVHPSKVPPTSGASRGLLEVVRQITTALGLVGLGASAVLLWLVLNPEKLSPRSTDESTLAASSESEPSDTPSSSFDRTLADEVAESRNWEAEGSLPPTSPLYPVEIVAHGDFVRDLLDHGYVHFLRSATEDRFLASPGSMQLPAGKYQIEFDSPVAIRDAGRIVEINSGSDNRVHLHATLANGGFQFPDLPREAGAFASYYGHLWREGWESQAAVEYELALEVLAVPESDHLGPWTWLKVSGKQLRDASGYSETAYLKVDADAWTRRKRLEIAKGFLEVSGRRLPSEVAKAHGLPDGSSFVVPFVPDRDVLAETGTVELPENRISMHDYLTLFFGADNLAAANQTIRTLRANLVQPDSRNAWLEEIDNSTGPVPCYVVSSHPRETGKKEAAFFVARRDQELFGFVEIHVQTPILKATCLLEQQSTHDALAQGLLDAELQRLSSLEVDIQALQRSGPAQPERLPDHFLSQHFDLATLPASPGRVDWSGTITAKEQTETLELSLRMLGTRETAQRTECCLELTVSSTLSGGDTHREFARLWIDADAYRSAAEFRVTEGWIAFDDLENIYEFPLNGDLTPLIDLRLQRQSPTAFDRIDMADMLALVFGADLSPKSPMGILRQSLSGALSGRERRPEAMERYAKIGQVQGFLWSLPKLPLVPSVSYEFFRSESVPFGFVSANLSVPTLVDRLTSIPAMTIGLETQSHSDAPESLFPSEPELESAVAANRQRITQRAVDGAQLWTWQDGDTTYKAWAQYAGKYDAHAISNSPYVVLLVDANNQVIRIPSSSLAEWHRKTLSEGRRWQAFQEERKFEFIEIKDGKAWFRSPGIRPRTATYATMPRVDREWIQRIRAQQLRGNDIRDMRLEWQDFSAYRSK